jgi:hypothetical protein
MNRIPTKINTAVSSGLALAGAVLVVVVVRNSGSGAP